MDCFFIIAPVIALYIDRSDNEPSISIDAPCIRRAPPGPKWGEFIDYQQL
jgi:hypothetical protein